MNTKKYILRPISILAMLAGLTISCSDSFFDTDTDGRIDTSKQYNSLIDAELARLGCFAYLQDITENVVLLDGLQSDQMDITDNSDADMMAINMHEVVTGNAYADLSTFYKMITNINEVLPNLPQIMEIDRDFDSLALVEYTGSLITLRAWGYFNLARLNGSTVRIEELTALDPSKPAVYYTKDQIIDQLIEELLPFFNAEDLYRYPLDHYALLGELYLEKDDYANAAKYLKYACDGASLKLQYMVDKAFQNEKWVNQFINTESLTASIMSVVAFNFEDGKGNTIEDWANNYYMVKPSAVIVNSFKNEIRKDNALGDLYRGAGFSYEVKNDNPYIMKYTHNSTQYCGDIILYRDADIHLMLAEALNRLGQTQSAMALMNNGFSALGNSVPSEYNKWKKNLGVRGRVALAIKTVPAEETNPTEYIEDLIMDERAKELAFEGKRWFDLIRIAERRGNPAYLANKVAAKFSDPTTASNVQNKLLTPANWYLPIPTMSSK